jgi:small subunit ribosomal protein S8
MFSDPIADFLCRLNNAARAQHPELEMPHSKLKESLAQVLQQEGYLTDVAVQGQSKKVIRIRLRFTGKKSVIEGVRRLSKPGRRVYAHCREIPKVLGGLGVVVLSTSSGLMTDREARRRNLGGELLCSVW